MDVGISTYCKLASEHCIEHYFSAPDVKKIPPIPVQRAPQGRALSFSEETSTPATPSTTKRKLPDVFSGLNGCGGCVVPTTASPSTASQPSTAKASFTSSPIQSTGNPANSGKVPGVFTSPGIQNVPRSFSVQGGTPDGISRVAQTGIQFPPKDSTGLPISQTLGRKLYETTTLNPKKNEYKSSPPFPVVQSTVGQRVSDKQHNLPTVTDAPQTQIFTDPSGQTGTPTSGTLPGIQRSNLEPATFSTLPGVSQNSKKGPVLIDARFGNVPADMNLDSPRTGKALLNQPESVRPLSRLQSAEKVRNGIEREGLPNGISMKDIMGLLYKFNYTVGFHGHHEEGFRNGDKKGGYFANGRDGFGRKVEYVANEFGYQPNITLVDLGLQSPDTPKENTEKDFGLKGYEFKWFYNK